MPSTLLEIRNLNIRRGKQTALQIDRLDIQSGEVLVVIGPNGAGKSTLLLAISQLLPAQGEIAFHGNIGKASNDGNIRRQIALVLQEPLLLNSSVYDNVATGLRFRNLSREVIEDRVSTYLERLHINHLRNRPARLLSGGEAQRVSLARAFALQTDLLLLDEPFSSLDAPTRAALLLDFQSLVASTGQTCVFVTHDLDEALMLGTRLAVIMNGQLRQVGAPEEVFSEPVDTEVAAFVGVETILPGRVIENRDELLIIQMDGHQVEAVGDALPGRAVMICLRPEDITLWKQKDMPVSSARNRLAGTITSMLPQGPLVRVTVDCGRPVSALLTRSSVREMDLQPGQSVVATFKASAVHLILR